MDTANQDKLELTFSRTFDAPRSLVWNVWTSPEHAFHWWGPKHHPAIKTEWDARPGQRWRNCLQSVETGERLWHSGEFREVVKPERLVFTFAWEESGERGLETLVTVVFTERAGRTEMTLHQVPFQSLGERDGHDEGWHSSFERLGEYLRGISI